MFSVASPRRFSRWIGALSVLLAASSLIVVTGGAASAASSKENDNGVVVRFEGSQGTSAAELAIADGTMEKALKPLGARAEAVGNFSSEAPAVQAIEGNALDIANGSITATAGALAGHAPIKIFAYGPDTAHGEGILVKKNSPITSVKDLEGKTVAVNQAGTGQYMLLQALAHYRVPISSVHQDYLLAPAGNAAFQAGAVDAWSTFGTFIPLAVQNDDARVLVYGGQVGSENDTISVVSDSFVAKYPHLLKVIQGVLTAESEKMMRNPGAYDTALIAADHLPAQEVTYSNAQLVPWRPLTPDVLKQLQRVVNFFARAGGIPKDVNLAANTIDLAPNSNGA